MSLPGVSDLAKQLVTNWEASGSLPTYLDEEEDEEEGELTCLSWLHNSNPHSMSPVPNIPTLPLPPKLRAKEETGDPMKELLSKKFQIQQKTSVKKLCQHFKILSQVKLLKIYQQVILLPNVYIFIIFVGVLFKHCIMRNWNNLK